MQSLFHTPIETVYAAIESDPMYALKLFDLFEIDRYELILRSPLPDLGADLITPLCSIYNTYLFRDISYDLINLPFLIVNKYPNATLCLALKLFYSRSCDARPKNCNVKLTRLVRAILINRDPLKIKHHITFHIDNILYSIHITNKAMSLEAKCVDY